MELSQLSMSNSCRQLLADILIYNPQTRPTAKQLIDKHPYFYGQTSMTLEKPVRNIIDRAVRLQAESLKNTAL